MTIKMTDKDKIIGTGSDVNWFACFSPFIGFCSEFVRMWHFPAASFFTCAQMQRTKLIRLTATRHLHGDARVSADVLI